ncbi:anti-sigma B factor antagonist [Lentzea fradiae]|uniref:Anti-sigma factor antagonist n=1 Tax=Lentzea fradiae TaxID=200378 RepID=A0A1G7KVV6_9PSEU|nr:STAS domain-containing protein [Lentzea fradiae]SDF41367.1 anti-sigma B factor antagonist [Lentzea fradiae]
MEATSELRENAVVLQVTGELDSYTAPLLQEHLGKAFTEAAEGGLAVVLDLTGISFLASSGLSVLVEYHLRGEDQGIPLRVVTPAGSALRALRATTLNETIQIYGTVPEALAGR